MTRLFAPFPFVVCLLAGLGASIAARVDVISVIKPNRSGGLNGQLGVPFAGKFSAMNVTVAELIGAAYGGVIPLGPARMTGLPSWAKSERFDVEAKADGAEPTADAEDDRAIAAAFAMVRTLLADRFALQVHETRREAAIYALIATSSRRTHLMPTRRDCDAIAKAGPFSAAPAGVDPALWGPCGVRVRRGEIVGAGATIDQLAQRLAPLAGIGRDVVNRTGIAGRFDFTLQWTPPQAPSSDSIDIGGPSLFTALQEQLGLKLESTRGPVRILVVDHLDHPTPN